jgi:hypothetical protein
MPFRPMNSHSQFGLEHKTKTASTLKITSQKINLGHIATDEVTMFSNGKICPDCHTESLHRSHRRGKDWFFNLLGLRPVRCTCCCQRFYVPVKL